MSTGYFEAYGFDVIYIFNVLKVAMDAEDTAESTTGDSYYEYKDYVNEQSSGDIGETIVPDSRSKTTWLNANPKGYFSKVKNPVKVNGISISALWDRWFKGDKSDPTNIIPPWRFIPPRDFTADYNKAKGAMEYIMKEVAKLKVLKKGERINTLDDEVEENLKNNAIMKAMERAEKVRRSLGETVPKGRRALKSLAFQTFYEKVAVDTAIKNYTSSGNCYTDPDDRSL